MLNKFDIEDMDGHDGYIPGGPKAIKEEHEYKIYSKMYDWSHDKYGDKTKPNFETWIKSLTDKEFKLIYKLINKKIL